MDDVTIEDEFQSNEQIPSQSQTKSNLVKYSFISEILNQEWIIYILLIAISIIIYLYINRNRRRNISNDYNHIDDQIKRYDQIERVRQRQQKDYEEQILRYAQQKKAKMEELKSSTNENCNKLKYRSNDHNPLTGQSNHNQGDSCSWRPSSRRKATGG